MDDVRTVEAGRSATEVPTEGLLEAGERIPPGFERSPTDTIPDPDLAECRTEPSSTTVCLERHSMMLLEPASDSFGVDAPSTHVLIGPTPSGIALQVVEQWA